VLLITWQTPIESKSQPNNLPCISFFWLFLHHKGFPESLESETDSWGKEEGGKGFLATETSYVRVERAWLSVMELKDIRDQGLFFWFCPYVWF
jgi:hypothetical protein